jgi:hypothetical protein
VVRARRGAARRGAARRGAAARPRAWLALTRGAPPSADGD